METSFLHMLYMTIVDNGLSTKNTKLFKATSKKKSSAERKLVYDVFIFGR